MQLVAGASLSAKILPRRLSGDQAPVRAFPAATTQGPVDAIHRDVADLLAWYSSKNETERLHVAGPSAAPAAARAGAVVDKYLQEYNLHEWVMTQNLLKGTAPTTLVGLHRLASAEPSAAFAFGCSAPRRKRCSSLQFLRRWRDAGVRLGHIGKLDHVLEQDMQDKASLKGQRQMQKLVPYWAPGAARG